MISEAARVVKPGGLVTIFDGDYASLTFAANGHEFDAEMVRTILSLVVANSYVMRELPGMLRASGLEIANFQANVLAEAGVGHFFSSLAESYVPMVIKADLISRDRAESWLNAYRQASLSESAFASCNYYTYIARRPE